MTLLGKNIKNTPSFLPRLIPKIHKKAVEKINKEKKQTERKSFAQATKVDAASLLKLCKAFLTLCYNPRLYQRGG